MFKRILDIVLSGVGLFLTWPLGLLVMVTNAIFLGRPIFFLQPRWGKEGKVFLLIKFRSMSMDPSAHKKPLTPYGYWLRKLSLDEWPSLLNVLKGDLSLVGPRPLMTEFYCPSWRKAMRPGLTGLAQIKGRNAISWRKKFRYDLFYIRKNSFLWDIVLLFKTISVVLHTRGTTIAQGSSYAPMPKDDCAPGLVFYSRCPHNKENRGDG